MTARRWRIFSTPFPATSCSRFREDELYAIAHGHLAPGRTAQGAAVPALRPLRPFRLGAVCSRRATTINAGARERIHAILAKALNGRMSASMPAIDDSALVRIHYIIGRNAGPAPAGRYRARWNSRSPTPSRPGTMALSKRCAPVMAAAKACGWLMPRATRNSRPAITAFSRRHEAVRDLEDTGEALAAATAAQSRGARLAQGRRRAAALRLKLYVLGEDSAALGHRCRCSRIWD